MALAPAFSIAYNWVDSLQIWHMYAVALGKNFYIWCHEIATNQKYHMTLF